MIKLAMVKCPGNTVGYYQISIIQIMLHNYGCEHTPADQLNIMNPIPGTNTVIRQPQWIKVR